MTTTLDTAPVPVHTRLDIQQAAPSVYRAMLALNTAANGLGLEPALVDLVRVRASQVNGCAYCLAMHTREARQAGEREDRLYALSAWRETPLFTARERAALALTEAVTLVAEDHVPDAVYDAAREHFSETETAALIWAIVVINAWNRVAITTRMVFRAPG